MINCSVYIAALVCEVIIPSSAATVICNKGPKFASAKPEINFFFQMKNQAYQFHCLVFLSIDLSVHSFSLHIDYIKSPFPKMIVMYKYLKEPAYTFWLSFFSGSGLRPFLSMIWHKYLTCDVNNSHLSSTSLKPKPSSFENSYFVVSVFVYRFSPVHTIQISN